MNPIHDALLRHNRNTPRYTSYPTAPHFSDAVTAETTSGWLAGVSEEEDLSLYIHIPYCRKMCWYCGCNTRATRKYSPVSHYVEYLLRELKLAASSIGQNRVVSHIHFGGGSPSMLSPQDFDSIMQAARTRFTISPEAEIAIEIDPRELTEAKVAAYAKAGVNRVSFGIQDFHEDVQRAVNRRQPFYKVYDAIKLVRTYGIDIINLDLLYGLPHQTAEKIRANVNFAQALEPTRVTLFGYAHVPWMKKHMRLIDEAALPGARARLEQFDAGAEQLAIHGYQPVGLDHFVKPEDPMLAALENHTLRRNFQGYTTDKASQLLGLGVSAIGALNQGYYQNCTDTRSYFRMIDEGILPVAKGRSLTEEDRLRRSIIEELMCYGEIDLDAHCAGRKVKANMFADAFDELLILAKDELVTIKGSRISVATGASQAVRLVCAAFDSYLAPAPAQHAQVA